jgi:hypothetical protein
VSSTTSTTTTTTLPGSTLSFPPVADTYVDASVPTQGFGTAARLRADDSPTRQTFLRFAVSGVGSRPVSRAVVWLTVGSDSSAASDSGGTIHLITDNGWSEATTTYANRPAIDGPGLFPQGAVALDHVVAFDVTGAVTADGTYSFALDSASTNGVEYESREAAQGKPALVLTLGAVTSTTATTSTTTTTRPPGGSAVEVRVAASADDAEEHATGTIDLTSSDLELIHQSDDQTVGMRFVGLNIPRGATIRAAYIQFTVDEAQTEPTTLVIQGQAADSAPKFTTTSGNVSARARTAAAVAWPSVPAWTTVGEAGSNQRSPDISAVVQEIVDRAGWTPGNALAIIITGGGHRTAKSFDGDRAAAPLLHVEY